MTMLIRGVNTLLFAPVFVLYIVIVLSGNIMFIVAYFFAWILDAISKHTPMPKIYKLPRQIFREKNK